MRIVHLASGLGPTAAARHLSLIAPALGVEQTVLNLGDREPFGAVVRAADVAVRDIRFRNWLDWSRANEVRTAIAAFRPDVLHVWGNRAAVRANWLRVPGTRPPGAPVVVSDLKPAAGWTAKLIERTRHAAAVTRDSQPVLAEAKGEPSDLALPAGARVILNVGGFDETADPFRVANAFEILKHTLPAAHLVMVGDGPLKQQIETLVGRIALDDRRVHFVGSRTDVPALVARADVVLVAHHRGGRMIVREALAAGKPVVAWRTPDVSTLLPHGVLVPTGDQAGLASAVYRVLTDPAKIPAATAATSDTISVAAAARDWLEVYRSTHP